MTNQPIFTFTRQFSEIEGLQSAHTLSYALEADAAGGSVLTVSRFGSRERSIRQRVSARPEQASRLLQFFFENAVQPEHWPDLLADYCPEAAGSMAGSALGGV